MIVSWLNNVQMCKASIPTATRMILLGLGRIAVLRWPSCHPYNWHIFTRCRLSPWDMRLPNDTYYRIYEIPYGWDRKYVGSDVGCFIVELCEGGCTAGRGWILQLNFRGTPVRRVAAEDGMCFPFQLLTVYE